MHTDTLTCIIRTWEYVLYFPNEKHTELLKRENEPTLGWSKHLFRKKKIVVNLEGHIIFQRVEIWEQTMQGWKSAYKIRSGEQYR